MRWAIVKRIAGILAAVLAGVAGAAEMLDSVVGSSLVQWVLYAYYAVRVEVLLFIGAIVSWPLIARLARAVRVALEHVWTNRQDMNKAYRVAVALSVALLVTLGTGGKFLFDYAVAKKDFLSNYSIFVYHKALKEYRRGHAHRARAFLAACARFGYDTSCEADLAVLDERLARAKVFRAIHDELGPGNVRRLELQDAIVSNERDFEWHARQRRRYASELASLNADYRAALNAARTGNTARSTRLLRELHRSAYGFGSSDVLLAELQSKNQPTPYLDALRRLGTDRYVALATSWRQPKAITQNIRSEVVYVEPGETYPAVGEEVRKRDRIARWIGF